MTACRLPVRRSRSVLPDLVHGAKDRRRWLALAAIVAAQFMVVLDVAIVKVALPSIKTDLHFSQESLQWVIIAYSIFFEGVLLLGAHQVGRGGAWCATPAGHAAMA